MLSPAYVGGISGASKQIMVSKYSGARDTSRCASRSQWRRFFGRLGRGGATKGEALALSRALGASILGAVRSACWLMSSMPAFSLAACGHVRGGSER